MIYFDVVRGNRLFVALTAYLGLPVGALAGGRARCHLVDVARDGQSHKLTCVVRKAQPTTKAKAVVVYLTVPPDFALESAAVNAVSGQSDVSVSSTVSWSGPYTLTIDAIKADCAASGTLVLIVHGDLTKETVTCPSLPLFQPEACSRS